MLRVRSSLKPSGVVQGTYISLHSLHTHAQTKKSNDNKRYGISFFLCIVLKLLTDSVNRLNKRPKLIKYEDVTDEYHFYIINKMKQS